MTTRKSKSTSIHLFKIDGYFVSSVIHIICDKTKDKENVYISSYFVHKNRRIHPSSNRYQNQDIQNENPENIESKVKEIMIKDRSICIKEIAKQTGFTKYKIEKFYMKLRRNLNGRIK